MKHRTHGLIIALTLLVLPAAAVGEEPATEGVYIIFDGSGSMWGQLADGTHKVTAAKEVLKEFVAGDFGGKELALRAYGHRREGDCGDTELVVPFAAPAAALERISGFADGVNPKGKTPISRSLRAALDDFGGRSGEIILISDGIETCDEDPCALVREWMESDVAIRVHVVGLGLEEKEREAMACISQAAGTEYHDAGSASELAAGLAAIRETAGDPALVIRARTAAGEEVAVRGLAGAAGEETLEVTSHRRNKVPPGRWSLEVGILTHNGPIYRPVEVEVDVAAAGDTTVEVVVAEPPSVTARFVDADEEQHGSAITAYLDGEEAFTMRPFDRVYLEEGEYLFRARPNADNELSVRETFAAGEHKEILFEMVHTVHALIKIVAAGSGTDFRHNYELWQEGELRYQVHWSNGVQALPGTYELRLPRELTPFAYPGLVLTNDPEQHFRIEMPVGHVTFIYQKADGSRDTDDRVFVTREGAGSRGQSRYQEGGTPIPYPPGRYRSRGGGTKGARTRGTTTRWSSRWWRARSWRWCCG